MLSLRLFASLLLAGLATSPAYAEGDWEMAGYAAIDGRFFFDSPAFSGQKDNNGATIVLEPEWYYTDDANTVTIRPFARFDPFDDARSHVDFRQLDWLHEGDGFSFRAGFGKVFWGVTESNHLVDIINQTDVIEDVDGEDKFGQPMLQLTKPTDYGTFQLFYLPYFRERNYASTTGRLRGNPLIDDRQVSYDSGAEEWHPDVALRYEHTLGNWDIGLAHFHGTSREATLLSGTDATGAAIFTPHYDLIDQSSLDLQYTTDSTLWKLEAISRAGHGERFEAISGGFEYTFYNVGESGIDIGTLAEYHYDGRSSAAPATLTDNDLFLGTRIVLNNASDTELLAGAMLDRDGDSTLISAEFAHRLDDNWKLETDLRIYTDISSKSPSVALRQDDHVQVRLARYF